MDYCEKCGAAVVKIEMEIDGKKITIPLDKHSMDERYIFDGESWQKGKSGLSHFSTCQNFRRYRISK